MDSKADITINLHGPSRFDATKGAVTVTRRDVRILLLEGVHPSAVQRLQSEGFTVDSRAKSIPHAELIEIIPQYHVLGIRSKTQVNREVIEASKGSLMCICCFCIGTDQVDLRCATMNGIPVFNSPFSNTRSVAELALAEIIMLSRKAAHRSMQMHGGRWEKVATGCFEVRGKTLGIIGYGHVGTQLSTLAESLGMRVVFYDHAPKLCLGNASSLQSLDELLEVSDFVSLHVPLTAETRCMISTPQLNKMKRTACLLNLARGECVNVEDAAEALKSGRIAGLAADVYPSEPLENGTGFVSCLQGCPNTILTPHIGGSTEEAQAAIGVEVADRIVSLLDSGSPIQSVNFPQVDIPKERNRLRIVNVHDNVPGVLATLNTILRDHNISAQVQRCLRLLCAGTRSCACRCLTLLQVCGTNDHVGYFMCNGNAPLDFISILKHCLHLFSRHSHVSPPAVFNVYCSRHGQGSRSA
jgi:D-3-phosphoglycerate dehydrogenase